VEAVTFTNKVERLKLAILAGRDPAATAASIAEDVSRLPQFVFDDPLCQVAAELCLAPELRTATPAQLNLVIDQLAGRMKNRRERPSSFLVLDLQDAIALNGFILLKGGTERVYVKDYREWVEQRVLELVATHPTIEAISRGEAVTDEQLIALERTLRQALGGSDVELAEENIRKAFGMKVGSLLEFLRRLLELGAIPDYAAIVRRQFAGYIAANPFSADQTFFLRALENVFLQRRRLALPDLYAPPLTAFGAEAVERLFTPEQVEQLLAFAETLAV
jgi:type I restriction enzyme, R subunit